MTTESRTIDLTPTWESVLPFYIAAIRDGSDEGRRIAVDELRRMAQIADRYNASARAQAASELAV